MKQRGRLPIESVEAKAANGSTVLRRDFGSMDEFRAVISRPEFVAEMKKEDDADRRAWAGASYRDALGWLDTGGSESLAQSAEIGDYDLTSSTASYSIGQTVGPGCPLIPAYLSGVPDCNLEIVPAEGIGPARIWVSMSSLWSVGSSEVLKRAGAVYALARKLSATRPVEIRPFYAVSLHGPGSQIVLSTYRLSEPLSLAELAMVLHVGFQRTVGVAAVKAISEDMRPSVPFAFKPSTPEQERSDHITQAFGPGEFEPGDIFVGSVREPIRDPAAWIDGYVRASREAA